MIFFFLWVSLPCLPHAVPQASLEQEKPKTPPAPLPDIPETALHTELLFQALDENNMKDIRELVTVSNGDLSAHDWLHHRGRTPLHRCVELANVPLMELCIVELGANVNVQDANGRTPLHLAARMGLNDIMRVLVQADEIEWGLGSHHKGHSVLHVAAVHGHPDVTRTLLEAGAPVNQQNNVGETALHMAAQYDNVSVAQVLLSAGADPTIQTTEFHHEPLHYACAVGANDVALLLQRVGQTVHAPEREGVRTALDLSCSFGHHRLGGLLLKEERRKREEQESRRRVAVLAAEAEAAEAKREAARLRIIRARERVLAKRAADRAARKAEEAELKRLDQEKAAKAQKEAMARIRRLAKERKAADNALVRKKRPSRPPPTL